MATNNHPRIFVIEINNFDENEHEILLYSSMENALMALLEDLADGLACIPNKEVAMAGK